MNQPLSPRQAEVLRTMLLSRGSTKTERIAEELGISPTTVKAHLGAVFVKLGVSSRCHAVAEYCRESGRPWNEDPIIIIDGWEKTWEPDS